MEIKTKSIVERMMSAYHVKTMSELGDKLELGNGTVNTWIRRNFFPGKEIIQCIFETGVSMSWLVNGQGSMFEDVLNQKKSQIKLVNSSTLNNGLLNDLDEVALDTTFIDHELSDPLVVHWDKKKYVIEKSFVNVVNGEWMISIGGLVSIAKLTKVPGNKWRVDEVDWPEDEIKILGKVVAVVEVR